MNAIKEDVKKLIDKLPNNITYDDIMYEIYVKQKIKKGLQEVKEGKTISLDEAKKRLLSK